MKRGLSITLGTIAMAILANAGYANAPIFKRINDVVIGDADDNQHGLTVDTNFFRYENAFNILDYVTDETTSLLRFSFVEGNDNENVSINGAHQLSSQGLTPEGDHPDWRTDSSVEITGGGTDYWFSFRDLLRSPDDRAIPDPVNPADEAEALARRFPDPLDEGGNPVTSGTAQALAWQNIDGSTTLGSDGSPTGETAFKRLITLVGSDDTTVSYQSFYVWSVNDVYDTLSGGFTTLFSDDFSQALDWFYFNAAPGFPAATSSSGTGFIALTAPTTSAAYGGWGTNPATDPLNLGLVGQIPNINADEIYVAHLNLKHNAPDRGSAPNLRLRAQMPVEIMYHQWYFRNFPAGALDDDQVNPFTPATDVEKTYSLYWSPNNWVPGFDDLEATVGAEVIDTRSYSLFFDVIDEGAAQAGVWTLSYAEVGVTDRPETQTPDLTMSNLTTTNTTWSPFSVQNPGNPSMSVINNSPDTGMITFDDPGVDLTPPGDDPPNYVLLTYLETVGWDNTTYRVTARLSHPTATDRANAHRFRLRHNTTISQLVHEFWLNQNLKGLGGANQNPTMPIVSDGDPNVFTPYEAYLDGFGGGTATLKNVGGSDFTLWNLSLDQLHHFQGTGQEELPTQLSVHGILYESLGPLGL